MLQLFKNGSAIGKALAVLLLLLFISIYACAGENDTHNETNASGLQQENTSAQIHADTSAEAVSSNPGQKANDTPLNQSQNNSIPEPIKYISFAFVLIAILITGIFGFFLIRNNYCDFLKPGEIKENEFYKISLAMIIGIVLVLSCIYLLLYLISLQIGQIVVPANLSNAFLIIISVLLGLAVFGSVIFMCQMHSRMKEKETGVMRKTIATLLVIGLIVVIFFALTKPNIGNEGLITQYMQLVGIIVAFYFGSRSTGSAVEAANAENKRKDEAVAAAKAKKREEEAAAAAEAKKPEEEAAAAAEAKKPEEEAAAVAEAKMREEEAAAVAEAKMREEEAAADAEAKKQLDEEGASKKEDTISY